MKMKPKSFHRTDDTLFFCDPECDDSHEQNLGGLDPRYSKRGAQTRSTGLPISGPTIRMTAVRGSSWKPQWGW